MAIFFFISSHFSRKGGHRNLEDAFLSAESDLKVTIPPLWVFSGHLVKPFLPQFQGTISQGYNQNTISVLEWQTNLKPYAEGTR